MNGEQTRMDFGGSSGSDTDVQLVTRYWNYFVWRARFRDVAEWLRQPYSFEGHLHVPHVVWPADRRWFLATLYSGHSNYLAACAKARRGRSRFASSPRRIHRSPRMQPKRVTQRFAVTVRPPSEAERGKWHGWRLELLRKLAIKGNQ